jgi:protein-disulfide isomerase
VPPARRREPARVSAKQLALAIGSALAVATALIAFSVLGSRETDAASVQASSHMGAAHGRHALFQGVPQHGIVLGRPDAEVTLVEYADLQCPFCARFARDAFPTIVDDYVRTGRIRVVFRGLAFIGPDSEKALRAALAAGEQNRLWDVVHGLFVRQGAENSGWVSDQLFHSFGGAGLDTHTMLERTQSAWVERQLADAQMSADAGGVQGTPSFQIGRTGGRLAPLHVTGLDAETFRRALDLALAG